MVTTVVTCFFIGKKSTYEILHRFMRTTDVISPHLFFIFWVGFSTHNMIITSFTSITDVINLHFFALSIQFLYWTIFNTSVIFIYFTLIVQLIKIYVPYLHYTYIYWWSNKYKNSSIIDWNIFYTLVHDLNNIKII